MTYGRVVRAVCGAVACAWLWTGCAGGGTGDGGGSGGAGGSVGSRSGDERAGPGAGPQSSSGTPARGARLTPRPTKPAFDPDPARVPKTRAGARELARAVVAGPELWGPDFVRRSPFLSPDGHWPVLDANCVWRGGTPPSDVLHSVTSYSQLPAAAGRGTLRVAATVTVHRDTTAAEWEMAETLEEALRCPEQKLREGERVKGLQSLGSSFGFGRNHTAEDSISELGKYHDDQAGGVHEYGWFQSRLGKITVATVVKGAQGYRADDVIRACAETLTGMLSRLEKQLEGEG